MSWNQGHLLKSGQYEVVRLLGSGGFGMTYLAKDLSLERPVVIKRPNLSFEADRDYDKFLRRFKREGQVLAQVQIPHIVRVIEFTEIDGMPCLVMDFVAGETLNECIRRRGYIPEDEAVKLFQKLASAVEALHQQGIIHCDIHPGNIIVQPNGEPMLIDFGSTKLLHPTTWTVTTTVNKDFGPYDQMAASTENALGSQPAWDIYSLAANMFFAVTGQKPMSAISRKLYGDSLKAPKELKPDLTDRLNQVILQGMALEAGDRPCSVIIWISLLDISPQPLSQDKISQSNTTETISKNQESKSLLSVPLEQQKNIDSSLLKKKLRAVFPWSSISLMVSGYFLYGLTVEKYSGEALAGGGAFAGALAGALAGTLAGAEAGTAFLAAFGALVGALIVGASGTIFGYSAVIWAVSSTVIWAVFYKNKWIEDSAIISFSITTLGAALLGGLISGYIANSGAIKGLYYGLLIWAILVAIVGGHNSSEFILNKSHNNIQVFVIYGIFSSIGLISGGMLGSWLKVAGILKLP
jgi:serine/threonine protein kinase